MSQGRNEPNNKVETAVHRIRTAKEKQTTICTIHIPSFLKLFLAFILKMNLKPSIP